MVAISAADSLPGVGSSPLRTSQRMKVRGQAPGVGRRKEGRKECPL